ncbi:adhesion G-protein coupled receptor V1-like [Mercenaria mercenaria]|uniref:adhesion G-protein coupled receptor V1-like n=1 Tax=Mercenaria mercenaria TaxID=6596 RepID=UPI00234F2EC9|nr:adhesion G-protein coupled receptor V1-like [Mercenaria mercenaria]
MSGDYEPKIAGQVTFNTGEAQKEILIRVLDDSVAEGPETFYLQVYDIIGDVVFNSTNQVNITILDNDEAYGIFHFAAPFSQEVEEGSSVNYAITRDGGTFGGVEVFYELFHTLTNEKAYNGGDFVVAEGLSERFEKGERTKYISLSPRDDDEPENERTYTILITRVEVFDGRTDVSLARIADVDTSATITILASDSPNGKFGFPVESQAVSIAEDYYPGMASTTQVSLKVERRMGIFGTVEVMWEAYSDRVAGGLPKVYDLIFLGTIPSSLMLVPSLRRPGTGTHVVSFSGNSAALILIHNFLQPPMEEIVDGFSISAWVQPFSLTNGYIMAKTNPDGSRHFYTLRMATNSLQTNLTFGYSITGSNENAFEYVTYQRNIEDTMWHHVAVTVDQETINFFIDAIIIGSRPLATFQTIIDNFGSLTVGAKYPGSDQFSGYLQDVRVYNRKFTDAEILELYMMPAGLDITPISGYITYPTASQNGNIDIQSIQDSEEESDERFTVRLLAAKGGASLSLSDNLATVTVLKSDNANGLFSFPQQCQPALPATESTSITCTIARQRGDDGQVIVTWAVYQLFSGQFTLASEDFVEYTGQVVFEAGDRSETFSVQLKADGIPEPEEVFEIRLVNVTTEDGTVGTTNISGASIDTTLRSSVVTMRENDFLNGLLQFSTSLIPPRPEDPFIPPAQERPTVRVAEEAGIVRLLVVRAQGYQGEVTVEWKTTDGTAKSFGKTPPDYSVSIHLLCYN